ncbi:hypothetical protein [Pontibacter russatus]|uniref:hypothetical protein n=1 Tax=Pontibacter russatus TaxID=2694929 RepID=UPI00192A51AB|nr:hypothetical protein [Pontibacter russatus]
MLESSVKTPSIEVVHDPITKQAICHIIKATYSPDKTEFYTPEDYSQQLGIIKYPKEGLIKPHYHNKLSREVFLTQEVLVIRKGKVKVNLYDQHLGYICSKILNQGDTILLASGDMALRCWRIQRCWKSSRVHIME